LWVWKVEGSFGGMEEEEEEVRAEMSVVVVVAVELAPRARRRG
jgi:hypothetical protein